MTFELDGITDPSDFAGEKWQAFDREFRCGICFEFFDTCMMFKVCSHNFCSLCIHRYLATENKCPLCLTHCTTTDLVNNRSLDRLVKLYCKQRPQLIVFSQPNSNSQSQPGPDSLDSKNTDSTITKPESSSVLSPLVKSENNSTIETSKLPSSMVKCPCCLLAIPSHLVNQHLDIYCLKGLQDPEIYELTLSARKPADSSKPLAKEKLPKLAYSMLKDRDLKEKLAALGLPCQGTRLVGRRFYFFSLSRILSN
eukprot:Sdes_comp19373_c0_seq1m10629